MNIKNLPKQRLVLQLIIGLAFCGSSFIAVAQIVTGPTSDNLQQPMARLGEFSSGTKISKQVLKAQTGVNVVIKNAPSDAKYSVVGFSVKMVDDSNKVKEAYCEGASFSPLAKQYINDYVRSGDVLAIQNIWVKDADGKRIKLPALLYRIE